MPLWTCIELLCGGRSVQCFFVFATVAIVMLKSTVIPGIVSVYNFSTFELFETEGKLVAVEDVSSDKAESGFITKELTFTFTDSLGMEHKNYSYSFYVPFTIGQSVSVEYILTKPTYARIKGLHYHPLSHLFSIFFACYILLILMILTYQIGARIKIIRLAVKGTLTNARVEKARHYESRVSGLFRHEYTFVYDIESGHPEKERTQSVQLTLTSIHILNVGSKCELLYLSERPHNAVTVNSLPVKISLDGNKAVVGSSVADVKLLMIIPLLFLLSLII